MKYFNLEAEVAGGLGPHSVVQEGPGELLVYRLHYVFEGWLGDEIIESTPCLLVSEELAKSIAGEGLTGVVFAQVEIDQSETFKELHPDEELPPFVWMKVIGVEGKDDFFLAGYGHCVVSERALSVILPYASHAVISDFTKSIG